MKKMSADVKKNIYNFFLLLVFYGLIFYKLYQLHLFPKHLAITYLISVGGLLFFFCIITKKVYNNMSTFFLLTYMLIGLLPYFHYLLYSHNKENYSFDFEYLEKNISNYKEELKSYSDSMCILELKSSQYASKINYSLKNEKQIINEFVFVVKHLAGKGAVVLPARNFYVPDTTPDDGRYNEKEVEIYKNDKKIATLKLGLGDLIDGINHYIKEKNILISKIQNPKQYIPFNDVWLDSVTGFIFSFIKPLSTLSQIIRMLQLITAFFLFYMINSWLKLSKKLDISKKNEPI